MSGNEPENRSAGIGLDHWGTKYLWPFYSNKKRELIAARNPMFGTDILSVWIKLSFLEIYPPDGADLLSHKERDNFSVEIAKNKSLFRILSLSFFGLPNPIDLKQLVKTLDIAPHDYKLYALDESKLNKDQYEAQLGEKIWRKFTHWPSRKEERNPGVWHVAKSLFFSLVNSCKVIIKTAWNICKLFTEFLPVVLELTTLKAIAHLIQCWKQDEGSKLLLGIRLVVLLPLFYVFKTWRLLGRIITSPAGSMRAAWQAGVELGEWHKIPVGKIVGGALATLSLAITIAVYVIIFPLGIKAAVANMRIFPEAFHAMANLPIVQQIGHAASQLAAPFITALKATLFHFKTELVSSLYSTAVAAVTAISVPVKALWNPIKKMLQKISTRADKQKDVVNESKKNPSSVPDLRRAAHSASLSGTESITRPRPSSAAVTHAHLLDRDRSSTEEAIDKILSSLRTIPLLTPAPIAAVASAASDPDDDLSNAP